MSDTKQRLIAEFEKNAVEKVKVHRQGWKGQEYIDVRIFYLDEHGAWLPTKKGITLNVELLPELRAAIEKVIAEVEGEAEEPGLGPEVADGKIPF